MKPARDWSAELENTPARKGVERIEGRNGEPTLRIDNVFLHSRYNPREEAERLVASAALDSTRPVMLVGVGLGYVVEALKKEGITVAAVEPDPLVARYAVEGLLHDAETLLGVGDADTIAATDNFRKFAAQMPQVLVHPPTVRLYPQFADAIMTKLTEASLTKQRLRIAIVGPMYGGSLPIAGYLERAFRQLGHQVLNVDNSTAWPLYQNVSGGIETKRAKQQLTNMLTTFLAEWSYARAAEFSPDICIVIAQAPVGPTFPQRLAKEGVVTAFWYVENWRHLTYWKDIAPHYDCFFHIQPGEFERQLNSIGTPCHAYVQTACDPELHKPVELSAEEHEIYDCDLSFAGAGYFNRVQLFKGLTDYNFKIWGVDWGARELAPLLRNPGARFTYEDFTRIVAGSKINLNLHSSMSHDGVDPKADAINPRVFEIAACGGFQLCDPCIGLDTLFDFDTELPVYRNITELRGKIDYFLTHPDERKQFVDRAREHALREHTYIHRAQQMLDVVLGQYGGRLLRKGIRVQHTNGEMVERLGLNSELGAFLNTLPPDLLFTHENINAQIAPGTGRAGMSYSEGLFTYLREVRSFAETLLGMN